MEVKISVIMPVYNCELFVTEALNSILNQTFSNFEVLVIDDCSTDNTVSVIEKIKDERIVLIRKEINTGYTNSLNMGIVLARGEFIARMDGDDFSFPTRFAKQLEVFDQQPEVVLCGTSMIISPSNVEMVFPEEHTLINVALLDGNCFAHPSVMFRRSFVIKHQLRYNPAFEPSEDFDLWTRMARHGNLHNLPQTLIRYRTHINQTSEIRRQEQRLKAQLVRENHLSSITTKRVAARFFDIEGIRLMNSQKKKAASLNWIENQCILLKRSNQKNSFFSELYFIRFLNNHKKKTIRVVLLTSNKYSPLLLWYCGSFVIRYWYLFSLSDVFKMLVKSFIFRKIR